MLAMLLACTAGTPTVPDSGTETSADTGTAPVYACDWAGYWDLVPSCDGAPMDQFVFETGSASVTASAPGCVAQLSVVRVVADAPCRVTEELQVDEDGAAMSGATTADPDGCWDLPPLSPFEVDLADVQSGPDEVVLTFGAQPPWMLVECAGVATVSLRLPVTR